MRESRHRSDCQAVFLYGEETKLCACPTEHVHEWEFREDLSWPKPGGAVWELRTYSCAACGELQTTKGP